MNKQIIITKSNFPGLIKSRHSNEISMVLILLAVFHSNSGRSKYISLNKLAYVYDSILCDTDKVTVPKQNVPPWTISKIIKPQLIHLLSNGLVAKI